MRKVINLNEYVYVKLDEKGKEIYKDYYKDVSEKLNLPFVAHIDSQGYTKFHLWEFMQIFGNSISLGFITPFDINILIDEESLK